MPEDDDKENLGYLIAGLLALLMIVPAMTVVGNLKAGHVVENQPVTDLNENDQYETRWAVENTSGSVFYVWMSDKPTYDEAVAKTDISDTGNIASITAEKEDTVVYPVDPWIAQLLQVIIPLVLVGGAVASFSKIASAVRSFKNYKGYLNFGSFVNFSNRGEVSSGGVISLVISVIIATVIIVKTLPFFTEMATNPGGLYGFGILIPFIPAILVVAVFYKVFDEAM